MKTRLYLYLFLLVFSPTTVRAIHFKHIGLAEGLTQLAILAIHQDGAGRMWFGTEEGLASYDGASVTLYKPSDLPASGNSTIGNQTHYIASDSLGNIFFDSDNALMHYDVRRQQFSLLRAKGVHCVAAIDGVIYIGAADSILTWDSATHRLRPYLRLASTEQHLTRIRRDHRGATWIGTSRGLYRHIPGNPLERIIGNADIYDLFEDSHHVLWISTRMNGLYTLRGDSLRHYTESDEPGLSICSNQVREFAEDDYGNLWIGTFRGLNKYNPATNSFEVYKQSFKPGGLSYNSVFPLFKDRQGTIWVGTYYGGVNYFNPRADLFEVYTAKFNTGHDGLSHPFVGKMVEDKEGNVWVGTEGGGLNYFDRHTRSFSYLTARADHRGLAHNNIKAILYSAERDKLYIGTHTGGLSIYDLKTGQFRNPYFESETYRTLAGDRIHDLQLRGDTLLMATENGIIALNLITEHLFPLFSEDNYSTNIYIDSHDCLWFANSHALYCRSLSHPSEAPKVFTFGERGLGSLPVLQVIEDRDGRIFVATQGGGLYEYQQDSDDFRAYTSHNSHLASDYCYALAITTSGNLLILGDQGLSLMNPESKRFRNIDLDRAMPLSGRTHNNGMTVCADGELFVGSGNGLVTLYEQNFFEAPESSRLYFTNLYVNNEPVSPSTARGSILSEAMPFTQHISLSYRQNNISLTFTSDNYVNRLERVGYEYRLEGYEHQWIPYRGGAIAYTNLNPGRYRLQVREVLDDDAYLPHSVSLLINIRTPWWATWWALILYAALTAAALWWFYAFKRRQLLLQSSLEMERHEKASMERLSQMKLQFFSNVSHEFRTPLTLVLMQLEQLMQSKTLSPYLYNRLYKIHHNASYLKNLITELLEFRRLENGQLELKVSEHNLSQFVDEIYETFKEYAAARSIRFELTLPSDQTPCWYDARQLRKVLFNLLSNAFKHTRSGGAVELMVDSNDERIEIRVIDNGNGIASSDLTKIFDRFYQADNRIHEIDKLTGGIGLALCKDIVELHKGKITVCSSPGCGSIFTVSLRQGNTHFAPEQLAVATDEPIFDDIEPYVPEPETGIEAEANNATAHTVPTEPEADERPTVLLVEDNGELLSSLRSLFAPSYRVLTATDGEDGFAIAKREKPDLVVSDVMMPRLTGDAMCARLKDGFSTCHIPVLLLTALSSEEQVADGYRMGADAYISKPFSTRVLMACCENLIRNRHLLRLALDDNAAPAPQPQASTGQAECADVATSASPTKRASLPTSVESRFLSEIEEVIERHLADINFDILTMAAEMGLSRSSLYNKFRDSTPLTPNDFVLRYKLRRASQLLKAKPELQVAELADMLGFGSPRYFARCFKAVYGITPTEYRRV